MNKELDEKLVKAFPLLYRDRYKSPQGTCMCFGFPGAGWFNIIWNLSEKLEPLIQDMINKTQTKRCICGCDLVEHSSDGKCFTVHKIAYSFNFDHMSISWSSKPHGYNEWKRFVLNKYLYRTFDRGRRILIERPINKLLGFLFRRFGLHKNMHCWCKGFVLEHPCASQVKEKFGTLSFYMTSYSNEIDKHIREAEELSSITCEDCGAPGVLRASGWLRTLCDECATHEVDGRKETYRPYSEVIKEMP